MALHVQHHSYRYIYTNNHLRNVLKILTFKINLSAVTILPSKLENRIFERRSQPTSRVSVILWQSRSFGTGETWVREAILRTMWRGNLEKGLPTLASYSSSDHSSNL
ncbi:hypothetical protein AVEN_120689-1 [Araneus ventricosus]|uniref:Uncharacterized protein n=1 Tax=Araneus ventricosus TaxID=182803 RepID=A0A4Y2HUW6_ARAVE|nr:hypothetical protein AVEN_251535-1 [Araneus ventricosus]GBM69170.1 hypothetical protein AVEN_81052-1 [Araneus ventricosus]GBM69175.1 hypothetical protein AVEN_107918-1 [Araneus ventricosus]GBM69182.1 hypothetical protein AVEN_120689-1 [Araneus ventricosus]